MAMGRSEGVQGDLMATWAEMPRSPGHAFYDRLQELLRRAGFDAFVEGVCRPYYAPRMGAPSLPPGRYFRMHMIGYFEGIDSERGIAWRCADSFSLRDFLRLSNRDKAPDHSWLSRTRSRLPHEAHDRGSEKASSCRLRRPNGSAPDSVLPLRLRSKRARSSALGVSIPLSFAIRVSISASASRDSSRRCRAARSCAAPRWPPSSSRRPRSARPSPDRAR